MYFPKLGATKALHVGLSDPTFIPGASALQLPGLATINGPLIVGGTAIDGIMGPVFPKTATVNIIPTLNAPGTALKISALGDGLTPFPGIGLQCSAINHNLLATTLISVTTPVFAITAPVTTKTGLSSKLGASFTFGLTSKLGKSLKLGSVVNVTPFKFDFNLFTSIFGAAPTNVDGFPIAPTLTTCLAKKSFDIPHPSKENHRLRYVCTETPEAGVYIRGKSKSDVIELPEYWKDLVHEDSITVNLTPVGSFQHLYVESIKDNKVVVGGGLPFNGEIVYNYHYTIFAERKDCERNIPEYEGNSPNDYPGDNSQSSVAGWNYDRRIS